MTQLEEGAKVLVLGPNWLGDCVMAEPAIRHLCETRPDLEVSVLVPEALQGVYADHPAIARTIAYKKRSEHKGFFGRGKLRGELAKEGFAAALLLRDSFGAAWDASRAGVATRVGFASFGRGWLLSEKVAYPEDHNRRHRTEAYLQLVAACGVETGETPLPAVQVSDEAAARADALIASDGGPPSDLVVGIHPGASYGPAKMWGEDRFAALADRLIEDYGGTILLLGTKGESELVSEVYRRIREGEGRPGAVRNLCGRTANVADLAAVFSRCSLVVGNDSGPVHLAAATGTPTVAIFGSTSADRTGVRGPRVANLWEHLDCSPCFKRECPKEDYMACMDAIPVARAYNACRELLGLEEPDFEDIQAAPGDAPAPPADDGIHS